MPYTRAEATRTITVTEAPPPPAPPGWIWYLILGGIAAATIILGAYLTTRK